MTKQEYIDWIHSATHITTDCNEYDESGNHYARDIFEKEGKLYSVEYVNGNIMDDLTFDGNGRAVNSGVFTLKEVKEFVETATRYKVVEREIT